MGNFSFISMEFLSSENQRLIFSLQFRIILSHCQFMIDKKGSLTFACDDTCQNWRLKCLLLWKKSSFSSFFIEFFHRFILTDFFLSSALARCTELLACFSKDRQYFSKQSNSMHCRIWLLWLQNTNYCNDSIYRNAETF